MTTDDIVESALFALRRAGSFGLAPYDLATAVIDDGALPNVPQDSRTSLGFEIGLDLAARGRVVVTPRNRFKLKAI